MRRQGTESLKVVISELNGKIITTWTGASNEAERVIPTKITSMQLVALRKKFALELQELKDSLGNELNQPSWSNIRKIVKTLHEIGNRFAWHVFGFARDSIDRIFSANCVGWNNRNTPIPIITVCGQTENLIPFEFFPCLSAPPTSGDFKKINNQVALESHLSSFLGFSCIFKRAGESGELGARVLCETDVLLNDPKLPMKLFVCRALKGVVLEEEKFDELKDYLKIDAWPRKGCLGNGKQLARFLWKTSHTTDAKANIIPDQIHHFASHYTATDEDSDEHFFTLAGCDKSQFSVKLKDLHTEFGAFSRNTNSAIKKRPLIFVNACDSSIICPDKISSLPDLFLNKLQSRGYIGTETTMSDSVAVEFSYQFYHRFLQGAQLGETLHDTRWWLVRRYRNPLGLFYTCYANPELRVSHPCSTYVC